MQRANVLTVRRPLAALIGLVSIVLLGGHLRSGGRPVAAQGPEKKAAKKDVAEKDVAKKDVAKKDVAEKDVAEKDVAEKDVAKKDVAEKDPAGKAELLRQLPKKFARFVAGDSTKSQVTLHVEGEAAEKTWRLAPDAEIKRHGWWGRLEQFQPGQRVWAWFDLDRQKKPTAVLMLADEISEQDLHGRPPTLDAVDPAKHTITLKPAKGEKRTLKLAGTVGVREQGEGFEFAATESSRHAPRVDDRTQSVPAMRVEAGDAVYVQSAGDSALAVLDADGLKAARRRQDLWLRERWRQHGLAGMVSFLHRLGGEMDVILDHEAIRWGRYLKAGDEVTLITSSPSAALAKGRDEAADEPIRGSVRQVTPWRERTTVRLVVSGFDQGLLAVGQRLHVKLPEPPTAVQDSELPTDIGRPRSRAERLEWFLSSVYCTCRIGGDGCTGMFYTLASCSAHNCGMPRRMRSDVAKLIDKGLTDEQIYAELRKTHGPLLTQQHLLP